MTPHKPNWTALLLSLMMVLVPAVGVPHEELLQDTLKSMGVGFFTLAAALAFFWPLRRRTAVLKLHWLLALSLALMLYAMGSMVWSHTYLAGVEAVRWFVFGLILFLGANSLTHQRVTLLAWCIHLGAVLASLWCARQFWLDWSFFAQGPNPASTFINRNFFAEFVVCTLPFSAFLLTRVRDKISVFLLMFSLAFNVVALMMTGTRSALVGLLLLTLLLPGIAVRYRSQCVSSGWRRHHVIGLVLLLFVTLFGLGSLPATNAQVIKDFGQTNAIERATQRTLSMTQADAYSSGSFSVRAQMWQATGRMIAANALTGVGSGAWEVFIPLYQDDTAQVETDYYAHNEVLQLIAEYGLIGAVFLVLLLAYLGSAALRTWRLGPEDIHQEAPLRAFTLASLLVLLLVSNAGFPWRLATTGALFALSLAVLAASDSRLAAGRANQVCRVGFKPVCCIAALCGLSVCTGLALYISQQAIECEAKLVRASKMALTIAASGAPNDPSWDEDKTLLLQLLKQGIAINPHYRKITPMAADALASWGDWRNATWVWESVLASRPYVVVMLANVARGQLQAGNIPNAQSYIDRAKKIQANASSLTTLQVMLWSRTGHEQEAMHEAQTLLQKGVIDRDLVQTAYFLGLQQHQPQLAILALERGIQAWPNRAVDGWLKLGDIYNSAEVGDPVKAKNAYQEAFNATAPPYKAMVLNRIPTIYRPPFP